MKSQEEMESNEQESNKRFENETPLMGTAYTFLAESGDSRFVHVMVFNAGNTFDISASTQGTTHTIDFTELSSLTTEEVTARLLDVSPGGRVIPGSLLCTINVEVAE